MTVQLFRGKFSEYFKKNLTFIEFKCKNRDFMKNSKKLIISLTSVLAVLVIAVVAGGLYLVSYALTPEMMTPEEAEKITRERHDVINPWLDSLQTCQALKDTFIVAPDGLKMHAMYAAASEPTTRTAVLVHGYTDQAVEMLHIGYLYHHDLGYNILMPDLRHAGQTGGPAVQMGWKDRLDVEQWISVAPELFGENLEIVVHGISMGAATTMMLSGDELPSTVKCFVEDCGYTSAWDQFSKELKGQFGLPAFPLLHVASWICDLKYGWTFKEASALEQLKKCKLPMLFIHGDSDDFVPTWMVHELYAVKSEPKQLWVSEGVAHARSYDTYPEEYTARVKAFTEQVFAEK